MSEIPLDPDGQVPQKGTGGGGIVIPDAVEALLVKVAALETTVATLGSEIETLKAGG